MHMHSNEKSQLPVKLVFSFRSTLKFYPYKYTFLASLQTMLQTSEGEYFCILHYVYSTMFWIFNLELNHQAPHKYLKHYITAWWTLLLLHYVVGYLYNIVA